MTCPLCDGRAARAIYLGFPLWICAEETGCNCVWGFWSFVPLHCPIVSEDADGDAGFAFMAYEGAYWRALLAWLLGGPDDD